MKCSNLTERQIEVLKQFIHNNSKHNMPICTCDVERVLKLQNNTWQCECGSEDYEDASLIDSGTGEVLDGSRNCLGCGKGYSIPKDDEQ